MHRRLFSSLMTLTGMILTALILTSLTWLAAPSASAVAGDWMFRSSFYSHDSEPAEMNYSSPSRTVYREPWVGAHPHSAVRSGWRSNSFVLHNGSSTDQTILRENWYDVNY